jgi:hypothetical protein
VDCRLIALELIEQTPRRVDIVRMKNAAASLKDDRRQISVRLAEFVTGRPALRTRIKP